MRTSKDLNACISSLEDLLRGGSVHSEKKQAVEHVIDELKRIRRRPGLERNEQNESIRKIVEELVRAFKNRD
jgi:hypothetical protein